MFLDSCSRSPNAQSGNFNAARFPAKIVDVLVHILAIFQNRFEYVQIEETSKKNSP